MAQPTFTQVREALAARVGVITSLSVYDENAEQVNAPAAIIAPVQGTFIRYGTTFDGSADPALRVILLTARANSSGGQAAIDPYLATSGDSSVYAAIQADPTLGGVVQSAALTEASGYGVISWNGIEYLGCSLIVEIQI